MRKYTRLMRGISCFDLSYKNSIGILLSEAIVLKKISKGRSVGSIH